MRLVAGSNQLRWSHIVATTLAASPIASAAIRVVRPNRCSGRRAASSSSGIAT